MLTVIKTPNCSFSNYFFRINSLKIENDCKNCCVVQNFLFINYLCETDYCLLLLCKTEKLSFLFLFCIVEALNCLTVGHWVNLTLKLCLALDANSPEQNCFKLLVLKEEHNPPDSLASSNVLGSTVFYLLN